ncbi:MAG: hypothetical protein DRN96_08830 [Thermoproteota archaeon]|nr:MAG: hypothetical protein DRN96_08830 [Candidatus Korarchaeota archaeon]RLG51823.1 MAG: hypothetical protein DRN99_08185 [Candidatus Korarchaeota archaeon]
MRKILEKAIEEYNRYRSPEVTAKLKAIAEGRFKVEFTGPFCSTCGFYDYFDDFRYVLLGIGVKSRIARVVELDEGAVVEFELE